ncbi:MAG: fumarylacetoacetate hydrolase family protein [Proteobacteria bacterium]|nr:fumarylacetoacetate hydrolase family protein [Pseudomonadota bacterium]
MEHISKSYIYVVVSFVFMSHCGINNETKDRSPPVANEDTPNAGSESDSLIQLVFFKQDGEPRLGLVLDEENGIPKRALDVNREILMLGGTVFSAAVYPTLRKTLEQYRENHLAFSSRVIELTKEKILPPIPQPVNIVGIGLNYREHNRDVHSDEMVVFPKNIPISGPFEPVAAPKEALLDWEVELGVVVREKIDENSPRLTRENVRNFIAGFIVGNDISDRVKIIRDSSDGFTASKTHETFLPVGPYYVPIENFGLNYRLYPELEMSLKVNGQDKQNSNTSNMIHSLGACIAEILKDKAKVWYDWHGANGPLLNTPHLGPGDLILTGTPGGTAIQVPSRAAIIFEGLVHLRDPREYLIEQQRKSGRFLKPGDVVRASIQGLGVQENSIVTDSR